VALLKASASQFGFGSCRVSRAEFLAEEAPKLEAWLKAQKHGTMTYMENHFDKRLNPQLLVEGSRSLVTLIFHYKPEVEMAEGSFKISKYAYGQDYHHVLKSKLKNWVAYLKEQIGDFACRVFVDSAPVLEKAWAARNGTGWVGKHTNIINQTMGSYFFLCEVISDLDLEPDPPATDHCGTCTRCIDACPTDALSNPYQIDATRCISYLTIELKEAIPNYFVGKMDDWIFGCDVCQDVCPWNRKFSVVASEPLFALNSTLKEFTRSDWMELELETFNKLFGRSALNRTRYEGLKRNIDFAALKLAQ